MKWLKKLYSCVKPYSFDCNEKLIKDYLLAKFARKVFPHDVRLTINKANLLAHIIGILITKTGNAYILKK